MARLFEHPGAAQNDREVYFDNAATAPLHPPVADVVTHAMQHTFGNPSSRHARGRAAKKMLDESRKTVAQAIGAHPDEIFFTSGGTESNNLAITGACAAYERDRGPGAIVTTALEHPSVTKTVRALKRSGWSAVYLEAHSGELDLVNLKDTLRENRDVRLVTIMSVQSELGYRFPVDEAVRLCKRQRDAAAEGSDVHLLIHTDAVQAFGKIALDAHALGVDLLSFCSHKVGGPKGIGALYVRRGTKLFTTAHGGGQEQGLRSGTEALPLIAGFAEAARIAHDGQARAHAQAEALRDRLIGTLRCLHPDLIVNSREDGSPFIVNFTLPGTDNRLILDRLSDAGIYLSASMACATNHASVPAGTWRKKHPLALQLAGVPKYLAQCTYRVSFSSRSTADEVDRFLRKFEEVVSAQQSRRSA
ncbi:cysteine desulfurase family protein [Gordonibacter sp.]|uniref:cysteine desulfurase family protein n=2 Tax=Gordonibacter sp. TaxID=1968902 RepID=UPI002FC9B038